MMRFGFLVILFGWLSLGIAISLDGATRTPAGTIIRNQAAVVFERNDNTGTVFRSTSNEVILEVTQVYGITITPDGDVAIPSQIQQAVSGVSANQVTFGFNLTFTGNTSDQATIELTFQNSDSDFTPRLVDGDAGMLVYNDLNLNGLVDSEDVLVSSWRDANADGILSASEIESLNLGKIYQPDEVATLLVTFFIPAGLGLGEEMYFGIDGESVGLNNGVPSTDEGNIAKVEVINDAVMSVVKSANISETSPGGVIEFSLYADSIGTEAAVQRSYEVDSITRYGVLLWDKIPIDQTSGEPLDVDNPNIEAGSEAGIFIYSDETNTETDPTLWNWVQDPADLAPNLVRIIGFLSAGNTTAPVASEDVDTGEFLSFTFEALVPVNAQDQVLINQAYVHYATNSLGPQTVKSRNDVRVQVRGGTDVLIRDTDFEAFAPALTPDDDEEEDRQRIPTAQAGSSVTFVNRVLNTGSGTDTFNIALHPSSVIPSGWNVTFLKSDGRTPLRDTGNDGIIDTGPLSPAGDDVDDPQAWVDVVVVLSIPSNVGTSSNAPTDPPLASIVVSASSVANSNESDLTENQLLNTVAASMNLANYIPPVTVEEDSIEKNSQAGGYVDFPLIVQNLADEDEGEFDTYALSVSSQPAGWVVVYYLDQNENGLLDSSEVLPIQNTPPVAAGDDVKVIARVFIDSNALADPDDDEVRESYDLVFHATSENSPAIFDSQADSVLLDWNDRFEIRPDRNGSVEPGGTVLYAHTLSNLGERALEFYVAIEEGSPAWTYLLLEEDASTLVPTAIDSFDSIEKYTFELNESGGANDEVTFYLRIFAPMNTAKGKVDVTSLNVTAIDPENPALRLQMEPMHSVVDVTVATKNDLVLVKSVVPGFSVLVSPGDSLEYTTDFSNRGSGPLTDVIIHDQISPHSNYLLQSGEVDFDGYSGTYHFELSRDGGSSWTLDNSGSLADPSVTNVRLILENPLPSGSSGSYSFQVIVK